MLKRLIAFTLTAVLLISCFGVSASAEGRSYEYENACLKLLTDLKIIDGTNNSASDICITRADAAKMFGNIFEVTGYTGTATFDDVSESMDCYDAVSLLCGMGIISKGDTFRPDDNITMEELITMAVNAIGLGSVARQNAEWPAGHMEIARKEGILRNAFWDSTGVMLSQAAIVMVNLLECEVNYYSESGYYTEGQSIMEYRYKTYRKVGIVTDNGVTALSGETKLGENQLAVDGVVFRVEENAEQWLGYCVEVYYRHSGKGGMDDIVAIAPLADENVLTELKYDETTYSNGTYTYDTDNGTKQLSVQPGTAIIYNGKALTPAQYADTSLYEMKPAYGTIKVLSNTGSKGDVSVLFIDNYKNVQAKRYDADDQLIVTYHNAGNLALKDKEYRIFDKNGEALTTSAITDKKPLLVANSIDGKFVKIIADGSAVTGEIASVWNESATKQYRIGDGVFYTTPNFSKTLNPGDCGTFYLDALGNIFWFDAEVGSSNTFAYVIDYTESEQALHTDIKVKMHTQFDMTQTVNIADSVEIDGVQYKRSSKKADILACLASCKGKVVMLSQNVKGDITVIDTANDGNTDGFQMVSGMDGSASVQYYLETGLLGGRAVCDDNTVFFMVPSSGADGEYVACTRATFEKIDTRTSGQREGVQAYVNGKDSVRVTALVQTANYTGLALAVSRASFVEEIAKSIKADGTPCYELTLTCRGATSAYQTEDLGVFDKVTCGTGKTPYTIGKGDIVCFGLNRNGEITYDGDGNSSLRVLYSAKNKYFETDTTINTAYSSSYVVSDNFKRIYVYDSTDLDGYYKCTYQDPATNTIADDDIYLYKLDSFATVLRYDKKRDVAGSGSVNDLKTYKDYPTEYSECVFFAYDFDFSSANYAFLAIYE